MDASSILAALAAVILAAVVASLPVLHHLKRQQHSPPDDHRHKQRRQLPPGSFGLPVVGQTLGLLRALRANTAEEWLRRWSASYGPVSRLSLFGCPTAFLVGPSSNKFLFGSAALTAKNTVSFNRMVGWRTIREVVGDEHRRVRAMMVQFLKLDAVKRYVGSMDGEVRHHLRTCWRGRGSLAVMPSMKSLTFDIMCTVIFGLGRGDHDAVRRELSAEFQQLVRGIWEIPVNLPFTAFGRCLAASRRGRRIVAGVIKERRGKLERGESSPADDIVTHMLAEGLPDEDIIDNVMLLIFDGGRARHHRHPPDLPDPAARQQQGGLRQGGAGAGGDREVQGCRGSSVMGGPWQDEVHMGGGDGDAADGSPLVRHLQESARRRGVRRLPDTQGMAGDVRDEHDAVGPCHLPGARQVRAGAVREPVGDSAVQLRAIRRRRARVPRERVREGGDSRGHALHRHPVQMEARRRLRRQLLQAPAAVPVPGAPRRHRAKGDNKCRHA